MGNKHAKERSQTHGAIINDGQLRSLVQSKLNEFYFEDGKTLTPEEVFASITGLQVYDEALEDNLLRLNLDQIAIPTSLAKGSLELA